VLFLESVLLQLLPARLPQRHPQVAASVAVGVVMLFEYISCRALAELVG
jgi:hypothetical protein